MTRKECEKRIEEIDSLYQDGYIKAIIKRRSLCKGWKKYPSIAYFVFKAIYNIFRYGSFIIFLYGIVSLLLRIINIFTGKILIPQWIFFTVSSEPFTGALILCLGSAIVFVFTPIIMTIFGENLKRKDIKALKENKKCIEEKKDGYLSAEKKLIKEMERDKNDSNTYHFKNIKYTIKAVREKDDIKEGMKEWEKEEQRKAEEQRKKNYENRNKPKKEAPTYSIVGRLKNSIGSFLNDTGAIDSCVVRCTSCDWNSEKGGSSLVCTKCGGSSTLYNVYPTTCAYCGGTSFRSCCPRCGAPVK